MKMKRVQLSPPQFLMAGFGITILIGTLLLMLPLSTADGISWMDAFFTATSATTVTGLVTVDTGTVFTLFGEAVIMILIQIGGLGFMTFAVLVILFLRKKITLKERLLIQEALSQTSIGGIVRLVLSLFIFSLIIELAGVILLATVWVPEYGWAEGLHVSLFHSISAFNNAGFSLWPDNLMGYVGDPVINLVITGLFILGGLGFTVLVDVYRKPQFKKLTLHSKLMIIGTLVINVIALLFIFFSEYSNTATIGNLPLSDKLWASYFQGVTTRTAGFNSVDIGSMEESSVLFMMVLMFIGAGSGSTGSGIKLTTAIIIILTFVTYLQNKSEVSVFGRTIRNNIVMRAFAITFAGFITIFMCLLGLTITDPELLFLEVAFEVFSAFGTVGLSMGITADLSAPGKLIIIILMFLGRVGPITLAFSLAAIKPDKVRYAKEDVYTG
ncbi:TrkH family potassium uptake protein [Jeotgalibacillus terrae]|uniref:TrkH family potassium uptake protein n=1 Tax=Jeotgalibacillus terrae TaxID=587735 RepID=A0ABW5ZD90_9BACL|nr:TrkH family potassium uptake protein [Jeotgalibacillus terrae]MBM7579086.1 trk system potassium uptake protein TrkH [Jeotgalibacillus terrae]